MVSNNFSVCFLFIGDQTRAVEERFRACEKVCEPWNDEMVIKKSNKTDCCFVYMSEIREGLEVTDDVSIVEYLKHPVYVTQGSYTNIKVNITLTSAFFTSLGC